MKILIIQQAMAKTDLNHNKNQMLKLFLSNYDLNSVVEQLILGIKKKNTKWLSLNTIFSKYF